MLILSFTIIVGGQQLPLLFAQVEGERGLLSSIPSSPKPTLQEYPVLLGSGPHDVAPTKDGKTVWYTAQQSGQLGLLDSTTRKTHQIELGNGSAPHGVIVGPDGAPWITDGGLNAIVRVDPSTEKVKLFPLPVGTGYANLNTATFDYSGILRFTGQSGIYGRLDPTTGKTEVFIQGFSSTSIPARNP